MDKTAIRNFAVWARQKLREEIMTRAGFLGITDKEILQPLPASTTDIQYFEIGADRPVSIHGAEIFQRERLARKLLEAAKETDYARAYANLVETTASDWFNRLIAIRYMEVNEYAPLDIRLLSSVEEGKQDPDLVSNPFDSSLEFSEKERQQIIEWKSHNNNDHLFRLLLVRMCNELHEILPGIFQARGDYSEILMRLSFIDQEGVIYKLVHDIPEEDWQDQVQIIGWMYQYYNSELKDETFALLKKNVKITKERIPSATQLFTPDWIVRYMVENSLGRLWLEGHPNEELKANWKYYLDEAQQEPAVEAKLADIREEYAKLQPEDIKCIDPCMGSGHILVYMFDVLMQIYESVGYSQREAAKSILENNIYGLDIDDRAYQLAYFAVMMKARRYNRRILTGGVAPHVYSIEESNGITVSILHELGRNLAQTERENAVKEAIKLVEELHDAKEYGSVLNISKYDWNLMRRFVSSEMDDNDQLQLSFYMEQEALRKLKRLCNIGQALSNKYHVVITNPPYMGGRNTNGLLSDYLSKKYPNSKTDLYSVFIERCLQMAEPNAFVSMITMHTFMFLSSFEQLMLKLSRAVTGSSTNAVIAALSRLSPVTPAFFSFPGKIFRNG